LYFGKLIGGDVMGVVIIAMEDVYFFDIHNKKRIVVGVPYHEQWHKFKRRAWRALSATQKKDVDSLKKQFVIEKQRTLGLMPVK